MVGIILVIGVIYLVSVILSPQEHKTGLTIFTIILALFGGFYEASGAKGEWNRRKRG